jgi:hypothetical protein
MSQERPLGREEPVGYSGPAAIRRETCEYFFTDVMADLTERAVAR